MWWWDQTHRVTTRQRVFTSKLGLSGPHAAHATHYEASDTTVLPRLLRRLNLPYKQYVFVDLGAGKGQALFLAAEFPFKRIVGVELSPALHQIGQHNCRTFRSRTQACTMIDLICADAADVEFPSDPLVVYVFNPFDASVLSRVVARLVRSLEDHPREVVLIYHSPRHGGVVESSGAFERILSGTDERDFRNIGYEVFRGIRAQILAPAVACCGAES
jgi:SAM-dependent methyltransferase